MINEIAEVVLVKCPGLGLIRQENNTIAVMIRKKDVNDEVVTLFKAVKNNNKSFQIKLFSVDDSKSCQVIA